MVQDPLPSGGADAAVLVALGGNEPSPAGPPAATLRAALGAIARDVGPVTAVSRFWRTPAWPPGSGDDFVNAACVVATDLPPAAILARLHAIEAALGRRRDRRWGPRTLDLDLIAVGQTILPDPATAAAWRDLPPDRQAEEAPGTLILPHPRLQDRGFVLFPLADCAPGWRHPALGLTVAAMRDALPAAARDGLWPLADDNPLVIPGASA